MRVQEDVVRVELGADLAEYGDFWVKRINMVAGEPVQFAPVGAAAMLLEEGVAVAHECFPWRLDRLMHTDGDAFLATARTELEGFSRHRAVLDRPADIWMFRLHQ